MSAFLQEEWQARFPGLPIAGAVRKAGCQQDKTTQQGDNCGILGTLHTLEIADGYDVDGKEHEAGGIQRQPFYRYAISRITAVYEHADNFRTAEYCDQGKTYTAAYGGFQCKQVGAADTQALVQAVVILIIGCADCAMALYTINIIGKK